MMLFAALAITAPAAAQQPTVETELRAELAKLKEQMARVEALLARLEKERSGAPDAPAPAASAQAAPAPAPPTRAPALLVPPPLPESRAEAFRKTPPRIDVLLQFRGDFFADTSRNDTFFLRKAELGVKGHISPHVDFALELDPVRANDPFRRTYIRLTHFRRLHFKLGLEKAPIGLEELIPNGQQSFVDRTEVNDRFAAAEELGVHAESRWDRWLFQFSVSSGGRRLLRDDNKHKDVAARAVFAPRPWISFGVATLQGETGTASLTRNRYNAEFKLGSNMTGFQTEFYRAQDGSIWSSASYAAAYWAIPVRSEWITHIQPVVRYEFIGRSDRDPLQELRLLTFGFSLMLDGHRSKFQANYLKDLHTGSRRDEFRLHYLVSF
jgi:hypothetical protein